MKTNIAALSALVLSSLSALIAAAQTSTWIPAQPGPPYPPPAADWGTASNWSPATVPNGPDAIAIFNNYVSETNRAPALITGNVQLSELRFNNPGSNNLLPDILVGNPGGPTSALTISGVGVTHITEGRFNDTPAIRLGSGTITFTGNAVVGPQVEIGLTAWPTGSAPPLPTGRVAFRDQSSAGGATLFALASSHGLHVGNFLQVDFHDSSSAGQSLINASGFVNFRDNSTAAQSRISVASSDPNDAGVTFLNRASAGQASIRLDVGTSVNFLNDSTAGAATISSPTYGRAVFRQSANAGTARIRFDSISSVQFADQSSTHRSEIMLTEGGRITFSDQATATDGTTIFARGPAWWPGEQSALYQTGALVEFTGQSRLNGALVESGGAVVFRDQAEATSGVLRIHGTARFEGNSSAGHALFQNSEGTVTFTDNANGGTAFLYGIKTLEFRGNSSAARGEIRADILRFAENASGGNARILGAGRIEILDSANLASTDLVSTSLLDLSGARTSGGTHQRVAAGTSAPSGAVIADNAREVAVQNLFNFSGSVILGSNHLVLRGTYLDGRITDFGGAYRDQSNRDFVGGGLIIDGGGRISNPGNDYSGPTIVRRGTLFLAGGALSSTTINPETLLYGFGTIKGDLVNNGTLNTNIQGYGFNRGVTVQGNYIQGLTGNLQMMVAPDNLNTLQVGGRAELQGGILHFFGGAFTAPGTVDFLRAASRTGQWAAVNLPNIGGGLAARVNYTATGAQLLIEAGSAQGAQFAEPPRGAASDSAQSNWIVLTPMGYRPGEQVRALFGVTATAPIETLVHAVSAHDPSVYGALPVSSFLAALSLQQKAEQQREFAIATLKEDETHLLSELSYRRESLGENAGAGRGRANGFLLHALRRRGDFTFGALLGYEDTRSTLVTARGQFATDRFTPGVSARWDDGELFAQAALAYTYEDHDLTRSIVYPGAALVARSTPRAQRVDASLLAGRSWKLGSFEATPALGAFASRWALGRFTESEVGPGGAELLDWRRNSIHARAGIDLAATWLDGRVQFRSGVHWWRELSTARQLGVRYAGATDTFALAGLPEDREFWQARAGLEWNVGDRWRASLQASGIRGDAARIDADLSAGLQWRF